MTAQHHPGQLDLTIDAAPHPDFLALQAAFRKQGHALHVDRHGFLAERWGQCRYLPTLQAAQAFLRQIGGSHE